MILKLLKDHHLKETPTCGELREILTAADYSQVNAGVGFLEAMSRHFFKIFSGYICGQGAQSALVF